MAVVMYKQCISGVLGMAYFCFWSLMLGCPESSIFLQKKTSFNSLVIIFVILVLALLSAALDGPG